MLALPATVVTRSAESERWIPDELRARGGPTVSWAAGRSTTAFSFTYDDDGHREMSVDAIGDPWTVADVRGWAGDSLGDALWVQVGALLRTDFSVATLAALGGERRLLLDAQGLARVAKVGPLARDDAVERDCFRHVAILKLNEGEAQILSGGHDPAAVRRIGVAETIVTLGDRGTAVVTPMHSEIVPPGPVAATKDPTGAGDLFGAAYLASRAGGAEPIDAARAAGAFVSRALAER